MRKYFFMFWLFPILGFGQVKEAVFQRAKIFYKTAENLMVLQAHGLAIDHGLYKKGCFVECDFSISELKIARDLGFEVEVVIDNVQNFYSNQNKNPVFATPVNVGCLNDFGVYQTPIHFNLGSMGGYLTYAQMHDELDEMHALYPDLIGARQPISNFVTQENRPIEFVKITKNPEMASTRPQILYTSVHHAREPISLSETIFYMWYLLENYATNNEVKAIVDHTELYFVPVVNPDGYVYNETTNPDGGGMWRKNRRAFSNGLFGVDNNRNYDYWIDGDPLLSIWNTTGISATADGETFPGEAPFSEPENQALRYFVENHDFKFALNAHTYSNLLLYPFGYDLNVPTLDDLYYQTISKTMVKENNYVNEIAASLYAASGDSDDFMYGQTMGHNKIFAFTPEIGSSFWPASTMILPLCNQMMYSNLTVAKLALDFVEINDISPKYLGNVAVLDASFKLTRLGIAMGGNYTVSINPISSNIASVGPGIVVSNLALMDTISGAISIEIANGTASGDDIVYEILVDNGDFVERKMCYKKFGFLQTVLASDCNSLGANFTSNSWSTTTEAFVSAGASITDSPNATYQNNQTKTILLSNSVDLTSQSGAAVSFAAKWNLEKSWDFVKFQVSTNNGQTWVSQCGKYTNLAGTPLEPLYDGEQNSWIQESISLNDYAGKVIKMRFLFSTDSAVNEDGFYFDDFKIGVLENTVLKNDRKTIPAFNFYPNPASKYLIVNCLRAHFDIQIFNLQGQLVLEQKNAVDNQKIDISYLSSGLYIIGLKSDDFFETKKFIKK